MTGVDEPDRRVIFHVGWPKTGTTSLQRALGGWPNLAGKPRDRPGYSLADRVLSELTFGEHFAPALLDGLLEHSQRDPSQPVIVSWEAFVGLPFTHIRKGHRGRRQVAERLLATSWEPSVLVTLREPRSLLRSSYLHEVKKGSGRTYAELLGDVPDQPDGSPRSWVDAIAPYHEALPAERLVVVWLEDLIDRPHEVWPAVAERLATPRLADLATVGLPRANTSVVAPPSMERFVNRHLLPDVNYTSAPVSRIRRLTRRRAYVPIRDALAPQLARFDRASHFDGTAAVEDGLVAEIGAAFDLLEEDHGVRAAMAGRADARPADEG